jgi:type I restriction enzyme S subunit
MTHGWETKMLGDVAEVNAGNPAPQAKSLFKDGTHPFFRTADAGRVRFGSIYEAADYLNDEGVRKLRRFPKGTILFPKSGASTFLNHRVMLGVDGCVASHLAAIVADEAQIEPKFLLYFLSTVAAQDLVQDHAYPSLNLPTIAGIGVRVPPLPEQRRIVSILDEAFEGVAVAEGSAERNLQNARALFESHLQSVFTRRGNGWQEKRLNEVSKDFGRGKSKHRPRNDPKLYGGKYPFIQTGDVRNSSHLITSYSQTYNEVGLAQSKLWPKGTLCITIAANIAETGILDFDACFPDSVIGVVVDNDVTSNGFLEYLLQSVKAALQAQGKGSAQDNINLGTFESQVFGFPSVREQPSIVKTLDALREQTQRLESIYQRKLEALEALKKSMLHQAFTFTGQLGGHAA